MRSRTSASEPPSTGLADAVTNALPAERPVVYIYRDINELPPAVRDSLKP